MNKLLALICLISFSFSAFTHSGRTDSNCGHNCSQASKDKGLCWGYHYHYANCYKKPLDNNSVAIEGATFIDQLNSKECSSDNENSQKVSKIFLKESHKHNHSH